MKSYILGITGASAMPLAERSLQLLLQHKYNVHVVLSRGAYEVWNSEIGVKIPIDTNKQKLFWSHRLNLSTDTLSCYRWNDNSAPIASGSYKTNGMVIVPCTMGTVGRIASGYSLNLIERCADVQIKEGRSLIIAPRETPWSPIHLKNLTTLAEVGVKVFPPIPAWYSQPRSIDEMVDFLVTRLFDLLDEDLYPIKRWTGNSK